MIDGPDTVIFISPEVKDDYGEVTTPGVEYEVPGCIVYPHTSSETTGRLAQVENGKTVLATTELLPAGLAAEWTAKYRGVKYTVEGDPGQWGFYDGDDAGTQIELRSGR